MVCGKERVCKGETVCARGREIACEGEKACGDRESVMGERACVRRERSEHVRGERNSVYEGEGGSM